MGKITFYIARHGKTLMNTLDKVQGWCDSPLTAEGIEVAQHLGIGLKDIQFRNTYTSDFSRTIQTARTVLKSANQPLVPIYENEGLREAFFGSFESLDNDTMWDYISLFLGFVTTDAMDEALYGGKIGYTHIQDAVAKIDRMGIAEDYATIETRTQRALRQIAELESKHGDGNILIVSHAMAIAIMLLSLGGDKLLKTDIKNASVCKVEYENGSFTVLSMGDTSYLEQGKILSGK